MTDGPLEEDILLQDRGDGLGDPQAESFTPGRRWVPSDLGEGEEQRVASCFSLVGGEHSIALWVLCQVEKKL